MQVILMCQIPCLSDTDDNIKIHMVYTHKILFSDNVILQKKKLRPKEVVQIAPNMSS